VQHRDPAEQHRVHHDRVPVPRHPQRHLLVDLEDGRVRVRRDQIVEHGGHSGQQLARALQLRDGVGEIGRRRVVRDRLDLSTVIGERLLEGGEKMLRLDRVKRRRLTWSLPGREQRVCLGLQCLSHQT
jgi:hypothetical protein